MTELNLVKLQVVPFGLPLVQPQLAVVRSVHDGHVVCLTIELLMVQYFGPFGELM